MMDKGERLNEYKKQNRCLKQQLEFKSQQIQDLRFQIQKIRKEQTIWQHLEDTSSKRDQQRQKTALNQENIKLKSQLVNIANQSDHLNQVILELKEKIDDLKYNNQQLKKLRDKSQEIHKKEISMFKKDTQGGEMVNSLRMQKQKLEKKIAKCDEIGREMQDFYLHQIQMLNTSMQEQREVIKRLERTVMELEQGKGQASEYYRSSYEKLKQVDFDEIVNRQNLSKKFEIMLIQTKNRYEKQISELKDNIKFLLLKMESQQDSKSYSDSGMASSILTQSKLVMSTSSNDSFKFAPNNSFSSSIKESLNRRETTGSIKTPNKTQRQSKNLHFLLDRTNI